MDFPDLIDLSVQNRRKAIRLDGITRALTATGKI